MCHLRVRQTIKPHKDGHLDWLGIGLIDTYSHLFSFNLWFPMGSPHFGSRTPILIICYICPWLTETSKTKQKGTIRLMPQPNLILSFTRAVYNWVGNCIHEWTQSPSNKHKERRKLVHNSQILRNIYGKQSLRERPLNLEQVEASLGTTNRRVLWYMTQTHRGWLQNTTHQIEYISASKFSHTINKLLIINKIVLKTDICVVRHKWVKKWRTQRPKLRERRGKLHGWTWCRNWWLSEEFLRRPSILGWWVRKRRRSRLSDYRGSLWSTSPPNPHMPFSPSHSKRAPFSVSLSVFLSKLCWENMRFRAALKEAACKKITNEDTRGLSKKDILWLRLYDYIVLYGVKL